MSLSRSLLLLLLSLLLLLCRPNAGLSLLRRIGVLRRMGEEPGRPLRPADAVSVSVVAAAAVAVADTKGRTLLSRSPRRRRMVRS